MHDGASRRARGAHRTRSLGIAGLVAGFMVLATTAPGWAASPSSASVGPSNASTGWTGQSYAAGATASPSLCSAGNTLCDHFTVSVAATAAYWNTHAGALRVSISWGSSSNNFDLYVYSGGSPAGSSASGSSTGESVSIGNPAGSYSVVVVPKLVTNSGYHGSASFSSQEKAPPPAPSPSGGGGNGGSGGNGGTGGGTGGGGPVPGGGSGTGGPGPGIPSLPGAPTSGGTGGGIGGATTGAGGSGTAPTGGQAGDPSHDFGTPSAPIFNYEGPFHFKPPFTVGDNPGGLVMPPQGASSGHVIMPPGSAGGGRVIHPPGSSSGSTDGSAADTNDGRVQVQTAGSSPGDGSPSPLWFLVPLGLLLAVAVGRVVFDQDDDVVKVPVSEATTGDGDAPATPPGGAFVMLGSAVRRLFRRRPGN